MEIVLQIDGVITLMIVLLAVILFMTGSLAPEITGLLCVGLLIITGILNPVDALAGFGSPALITLIGLFAISAGVFRSGCLDSLRELIGSDSIRSSRRIIILFTTIVAPLSALIPNTPIVSTLLPVVEGWCRRRDISTSKVLLPLSFATVLGGTLTLLGSSVNLLASDVSEQLGYGALDLFSLTSIGLPVWLLGSLYLVFSPSHWLVDRSQEPQGLIKNTIETDYIAEASIPADSVLVGQAAGYNKLHRLFDVEVLCMQRGSEKFSSALRNQILRGGDRILMKVSRENLFRIEETMIVEISSSSWKKYKPPLPNDKEDNIKVVEALLPSGSPMAGATLQELRFRERYKTTILGLRSGNDEIIQFQLGTTVLREGDLLLLESPLESICELQNSKNLLILEEIERKTCYGSHQPGALMIILGVIILPSLKLMPLVGAVLLGAAGMVSIGCLDTGDLQRSIRLDVILLLGSLASFSSAIEQTGISKALAQVMLNTISHWPVYICLALVFLGTTALTEVMSNGATVALLIPIASQLAIGLKVVPIAFIYAVIFGASQCFLSPVGYQTNLMVFGPGRYRFLDITRYGAPLTIMMTMEIPWLICHYFSLW